MIIYPKKSEKLMYLFYRSTKIIKQMSGILLPMLKGRVCRPVQKQVYPIDINYYQLGNRLAVSDYELFEREPEQIFYAMELMQRHKDIVGLAPRTLRAWWSAGRKIHMDFYANRENRMRFVGFFRHGEGLTHLLRHLNLYGVLGHYLPAFGKIVGLLQHDLFHIYPVDDHILMVVRNMRRLAMEEHVHEFPFASSLMSGFERKTVLYLSAFFHDIAKGRGGDHAIQGVEDAEQFAKDHELSPEEGALLSWLVRYHLLFSATAQKEDIQDPDVIERFCEIVDTTEKLVALYLLTLADIRGTNPKIWNHWKGQLFENLFQVALHYLQGKGKDKNGLITWRRQQATDVLLQLNLPNKDQRKLWHLLGNTYFSSHDSSDIIWHIESIAKHPEEPIANIRTLPDGTLQVMVFIPNQERLFARLCQLFSQHSLDIIRARAFVTEHNFILDTFILSIPPHFLAEDHQRIQQELQQHLDRFILGEMDELLPLTATPCSRRLRHLPILSTVSIVDSDDSDSHYFTLYVVTYNRRGVLANIAGVLSDFNTSIRHAYIATLDERVEDKFLIYNPDLSDTKKRLALKEALLEKINL